MEGWGPNPADAIACRTGSDRPFLPTRTPRLRARISDPDGGVMDAGFRVYRGIPPNHTWDGNQAYIGQIPSGSFAEVTVASGVLPTDGIYTWQLWSGDYHLASWSPVCELQLDTVKPGAPAVTSPRYPADRAAGGVGQAGTFTFTPPAGTDDSAYYLYSFTAQGDDPQTRVTPAALNGSVTVSWTPALSGPQTLSVRAVDRAGNRSDITRYQVVVSDYQVGVSGKVASWSFEDSLQDGSNAKSLTYEGPPAGATYGAGHQGQGVVLDPAKAEHYLASDALIRTDTSFTVSAWARLDRTDGHHVIASQDGDRLSGFYFTYQHDVDRWTIVMSDRDSEITPVGYAAIGSAPPTLGVWTYLTGVFDASSHTLRLYVNGDLDGQGAAPPAAWNATGQFIVGAAKTEGQRAYHFPGAIDSVRVDQRALTDAEVDALYNGTATSSPTAEYLFEDNLENTGTNNDLVQSAPGTSYADGYAGGALRLDLTSRWVATAAPVINTTGSYSVSAWAKLDDKAGYYHIASQDGNRVSGFFLRYSTDVDRWIFGMPIMDADGAMVQWAIGRTVPRAGAWTHIAAVHDASTHELSLYVNGVLEAQRDLVSTIDATGQFIVGSTKANGVRTGQFRGALDEVNVYDGALTAGEVAGLANVPVERARYALNETAGAVANDSVGGAQASLYGTGITWGQHYGAASARFSGNYVEHAGTVAGGGPLARWDLNDTLSDSSGNGRDLVHANNAGPTPASFTGGRAGPGVSLNGDQRLTTTGPVVDTTGSFSVSAWVRLDRLDGRFTVASQDGAVSSPFALKRDLTLDRWSFTMIDGDRTDPGVVRALSTLPPQVDTWTHLLGVYDADAGMARLYVNGHLEGEVPFTSGWQSTGPFSIGRLKWNGSYVDFLPGGVDEVRVYDRVLTEADAHGLWNLGSNILVPRPNAFRTDQSWTVSAWVRHDGFDAAARQALSAGGDRYSPVLLGYRPEWRRWGVLVVVGSETQPVGRFVLSDDEAGTYADSNGWVHLAAVYDAPARRLLLYVNGRPQSTVPTSPTTVVRDENAGSDVTVWDSGRDLLIGRATWRGQPTDYWKGALRDVRVFSGVLPDDCGEGVPVCLRELPGS